MRLLRKLKKLREVLCRCTNALCHHPDMERPLASHGAGCWIFSGEASEKPYFSQWRIVDVVVFINKTLLMSRYLYRVQYTCTLR